MRRLSKAQWWSLQRHRPFDGTSRSVGASKWRPWDGVTEPSWARSWGRPAQLDGVPVADPDPAVEPEPAAFEVSVSTWCSWPVHARESLRAVTSWMKAPGVMRTDALDGATAERITGATSFDGSTLCEGRA